MKRPFRLAILVITLLALLPTLSACGKKGSPVRPGEEPRQETLF